MTYRRASPVVWSIAVVLALLVGLASASLATASPPAGFATPTPTETPPATPTPLQPPAAPTNLQFGVGILVWEDNSDNEDGFRLRKSVGENGEPPELVETLPANTTSTDIPDLPTEELCEGVTFSITAFNAAGESAPATSGMLQVLDACDGLVPAPTPTATPVEPVDFPETGGAAPEGGTMILAWLLLGGALGLALTAIALRRRWRTGPR